MWRCRSCRSTRSCGRSPTTRSTASRCWDCATGQRVSVRDLLYGLILRSGNDAAHDLAIAAAGSEARFVAQMNRHAAALGLADTHYANPIGLDQRGNYSSARDLATLSQRLMTMPAFARIADARYALLRSLQPPRRISTINELLLMAPWATGIKTGHTFDAGYVLVGSGRRKGVDLISVAIGAPTDEARYSDNLELLEYGFSQYRRRQPIRARPGPRRPRDPLLRRRTAAAGRPRRRSRPPPGPVASSSMYMPRPRSRARFAAAPGSAPRRCFVDGRPAGTVALAGRPHDPRGEHLRPSPRLRRGPSDPYRDRGVRDTDWRGIALPPSARPKRLTGANPRCKRRDPHRDSERGDRPYRRRAELPPRAPPPRGREPHRRRRQGHQRRPRPQPAGAPRDRRRLRRRPDRDPGARRAARRVGSDRLHPDRRRDPDQPRGDRPDLGRADRDQRARPRGQPRGDEGALRADRLPGRRRQDLRARRLAAARAPATTSTRA